MVMAAVVIITEGGKTVVITMGVAAAVVITPGKGSGKNPKKSSPRRKRGLPLGLLIQKGVQVGVINAPLDTLPA